VDGIKRSHVYAKRCFRAVDHGPIDWSEIEHGDQPAQFFAL
jgi:hypothetical protein